MKEKPALFSTPMVEAILNGKKTETRRILNPQPVNMPKGSYFDKYNGNYDSFTIWTHDNKMCLNCGGDRKDMAHWKAPYHPGQTIWVRETFTEVLVNGETVIQYRADEQDHTGFTWKPSIFLKRVDARIFLTCEDIYPEPLQAVSYESIINEGIKEKTVSGYGGHDLDENVEENARYRYQELWDGLNKKRGYGWSVNPYVWVIKFSIKEIKETNVKNTIRREEV